MLPTRSLRAFVFGRRPHIHRIFGLERSELVTINPPDFLGSAACSNIAWIDITPSRTVIVVAIIATMLPRILDAINRGFTGLPIILYRRLNGLNNVGV